MHRGLVRPEDAEAVPEPGKTLRTMKPLPCPVTARDARRGADRPQDGGTARDARAKPDVALVAVTHALARRPSTAPPANVPARRPDGAPTARMPSCGGSFAFDAERGKWAGRLPADADDLWTWCICQTQDTLLGCWPSPPPTRLTPCAKGTSEDPPRLSHADALANALRFDMPTWFQPTAENYFGRVKRDLITEAMTGGGTARPHPHVGENEEVRPRHDGRTRMHGTGWLPKPLRPVGSSVQLDWEVTGMSRRSGRLTPPATTGRIALRGAAGIFLPFPSSPSGRPIGVEV